MSTAPEFSAPTPTKIQVDVTGEDIWKARMSSVEQCAVARALRRALGNDAGFVYVGTTHATLEYRGQVYPNFRLPDVAAQKIKALIAASLPLGAIGRRLFVRPFSFTIEV